MCLGGWEKWHAGFKTLESCLFSSHTREHYIRTCLLPSPYSDRVEQFHKGFSKAHWEKRWNSLVVSLAKLKSLLVIFRATWDETKFNEGGADRPGGEFKTCDVTAVVRDSS
eukprot:11539009-Alexandrium_andersonii.AAC.1